MAQKMIQDSREDFLHCYICMKRYKKPLMLPCLHSFCFHCLKKYENKVQGKQLSCPICRRSLDLSDEGIEGLPHNFFLSSLVDRLELMEKSKEDKSPKCKLCQGVLNLLYCLDCQLHVCSTCKKRHTRTPGTRDHVIISAEKLADEECLKQLASTKTPRCDEHKEENLRLYCTKCFQLVCRDCKGTSHKGHKCVKAESEATSAKKSLEEIVEDSKEEIQGGLKLSESLKSSAKSLEEQAAKLLKQVDSQYDKCVEKLKSDREALRRKIENMKVKKCRSVEKTKGELSDVLQAMKNIGEVTSRLLEENNIWDILRMERDIVRSFEKIESDLESVCEDDSQVEDSTKEDYDIVSSSSDAYDSSDDDSSDSDSDADGSIDDKEGKKSHSVKSQGGDDHESVDEDANIGIKFRPSRIKPPDVSYGEIVAGSTSNWRNKNHVGKIVRSWNTE